MGERYLISGVQLGILQISKTEEERKKQIDEIIDKQFIGESKNDIVKDSQLVSSLIEEELNHYNKL